jgi:hypothetical protein
MFVGGWLSAGASYRDSQRERQRAVNPCCGKASLIQPAMQTALNLSTAAADREAAEAPLAPDGTADSKNFPAITTLRSRAKIFGLRKALSYPAGNPAIVQCKNDSCATDVRHLLCIQSLN